MIILTILLHLFYALSFICLIVCFFQFLGFLYLFIRDSEFRLSFLYQVDTASNYNTHSTLFQQKCYIIIQFINLILILLNSYPVSDKIIILPIFFYVFTLLFTCVYTFYAFFYLKNRENFFTHKTEELFSIEASYDAEESLCCKGSHTPPYKFSFYSLPPMMLRKDRTIAEEALFFLYSQIGQVLPSHEAFCKVVMKDLLYSLSHNVDYSNESISFNVNFLLYLISYNRLTTMKKEGPSYIFRCYDMYTLLFARSYSVLSNLSPSKFTPERLEREKKEIENYLKWDLMYVPSWERQESSIK